MAKKRKKTESVKNLVKKLYKIMLDRNLSEIKWEEKEKFSIKLRRKGALPRYITAEKAGKHREEKKKGKEAVFIRSPMNGIFYRAHSPGAHPFVEENQEAKAGDTVCIIEAMKLMNEVQVESHCRIKKVMVEDASAVKVNDPLFEIEIL
ncbi:MAG: acetyl-CoA carboxylase biotin carboxyl carrier protein [Elusimicrobiota bacterium]